MFVGVNTFLPQVTGGSTTGNARPFPAKKNPAYGSTSAVRPYHMVLDAVCYSNEPVPTAKPIETDVLIFTSSLSVAADLDHRKVPKETRVMAIGGGTVAALYQCGYVVPFLSYPSEEALVELIEINYLPH